MFETVVNVGVVGSLAGIHLRSCRQLLAWLGALRAAVFESHSELEKRLHEGLLISGGAQRLINLGSNLGRGRADKTDNEWREREEGDEGGREGGFEPVVNVGLAGGPAGCPVQNCRQRRACRSPCGLPFSTLLSMLALLENSPNSLPQRGDPAGFQF